MTATIAPIHIRAISLIVVSALFFTLLPAVYTISQNEIGRSTSTASVVQALRKKDVDYWYDTIAGAPRTRSSKRSRQLPVVGERMLVRGNDQVRIAVFGSSNAWGAALETRFDAFPYILSPEVVNYADYAAGPNYASVCANTMVKKNDDYDVIILDYWLKSSQGLEHLAKRLRRRFPRAVMIFSRLWSPSNVRRQPFQGSPDEMSIQEWKTSIGLSPKADYETVKDAILSADNNTTAYWYFPDFKQADQAHEAAVAAVGGMHFEFTMRPTVKETIVDYLGYFDEATHSHVSARGHAAIARAMKEIIQVQMDIVQHQDAATAPAILNGQSHDGTWGRGDSCHLWLTTGGCRYDYSANWTMIEYDPERGKFALHVQQEGWIDVVNDFDDNRTLYLSFLATNENWYPKTLVTFQGATTEIGTEHGATVSMELIPITGKDYHHAHLTKTVPVGMIPHGTTRVRLIPQDEPTTLPFRLVGASLTDEEAVPLEYSFGPEFNS